ncbi:MAG: hypothetical protein H0W08_04810 [Acidobacteria bacterium]|nr:hypothetical protein [Acidobacteriota bacterium]
MRGRRGLVVGLLLLLLSIQLRADVIDRILATVGGALILQTDVVAAARLGFVRPPAQGDSLQWTLDRLIERRLMLIEVDRYGPPEPDRSEVDRRMQEMDSRIGSGERLDAIIRETGLSVEQLRLYVRDDLRIDGYIEQRFGATFQPSEDDIVRYYRDHPAEFTRDGKLRPFNDARDDARAAIAAQLRAAAVREWLSGLRRRTEVNVLYFPGR